MHAFEDFVHFVIGTSPRPWGKALRVLLHPLRHRFIPTPVGKCATSGIFPTSGTVHPHARGEMVFQNLPLVQLDGSSPRPWGNGPRADLRPLADRFIPTPVGKCTSLTASVRPSPVHPHARGEMGLGGWRQNCAGGSSPRPWGNVPVPDFRRPVHRFIPTPVGKWCTCPLRGSPPAVHPHARGEMLVGQAHHLSQVGSSPRPWGNGS